MFEKSNENYGSFSLCNIFVDGWMELALDWAKAKQTQFMQLLWETRIEVDV